MADQRVRKDRGDDPDIKHGTLGGYLRAKCSCEDCRAYWVMRCRQQEQSRIALKEAMVEHIRPVLSDPSITTPEKVAKVLGLRVERVRRLVRDGQWQGSPTQLRRIAKYLKIKLPM